MGLVGFEPTQHLIRLLPTIHLVPIHKFTKYLLNNLPQLFVRTTLTITLAVKQEPPYDAVATDLRISCEAQGIYTPQGGAEHRRVLELLSQKKGGMGFYTQRRIRDLNPCMDSTHIQVSNLLPSATRSILQIWLC